jgi:predicted nucleotide-binding protein
MFLADKNKYFHEELIVSQLPLPEKYWHCFVQMKIGLKNKREYSVANDLSIEELESQIVRPWHEGKRFVVNGKIVANHVDIDEIKITQTPQPQQFYADRHNAKMRQSGVADLATDRKRLPLSIGQDYTHDLLFRQQSVVSMEGEPEFDVFIVHGHDNYVKESLARFLEKNSIKPIILHEQPSLGKTLIEKFESFSGVKFAIILLTRDDQGCSIDSEVLSGRARQNVIFEMGYFVGKIGREKTAIIYKEDVELPSDLDGLVYIKYDDAGAWKLLLAKELKEAGLEIDLNKCF